MALLIHSDRCSICRDIVSWLQENKQVAQIIRLHDVNVNGIPQKYKNKIKVVPSLLTQNGKFLTGSEVKAWLKSMAPTKELANFGFGGRGNMHGLDDDDDDEDIFSIENYGQSIQPAITKELDERINAAVMDNYQKVQSDGTN
tara:strand:- start:401 stop:829 length:429 start_codon:yes stop_codon:yes gene_type:complete